MFRQQICDRISDILATIPNYDSIGYWQSSPAQYDKNVLFFRDTEESYKHQNSLIEARLEIEIVAVVVERSRNVVIETQLSAAQLGNIALADLISALASFELRGAFYQLVRSHKYVETRGKTACQIELNAAISYKFQI